MLYLRDPRNVCRQLRKRWNLVLGMGVVGLLLVVVVCGVLRSGVVSRRPMPRAAFADPMAHLLRVMLWAWERREDLRTLDPRVVGVADLAKSLFLSHYHDHAHSPAASRCPALHGAHHDGTR